MKRRFRVKPEQLLVWLILSSIFKFVCDTVKLGILRKNDDLFPSFSVKTSDHHWQTVVEIIVPGFGDLTRLGGLKKSLETLMMTSGVLLGCQVYVYNSTILSIARDELSFCEVRLSLGRWTDHMKAVDEFPVIARHTATHIAVLIDDIDTTEINFFRFIQLMKHSDFGVASASISQWHYSAMHEREKCSTHQSDYTDILFTVFTIASWGCWVNLLRKSPENSFGWGFDIVLADQCNVSIGIIDEAKASHAGICDNGGDCTRSYNESLALSQLWQYIQKQTQASNENEARNFHHFVTNDRPKSFPICHLWREEYLLRLKLSGIKLKLSDESYYKTVTHRGGWKVVIESLIKSGLLNDAIAAHDENKLPTSTEDIRFFDLTEKHFYWEQKGFVTEPWVGIMHLAMSLPSHIEQSLHLENLLTHEAFLGSLPHCIALVVLSDDTKTKVEKALQSFENLNVCTLRHPITVEQNATLFSNKDLDMIFSQNSGIILVGQQYRRLATIHRIKTSRQKFWLPGMPANSAAANHVKGRLIEELKADNMTQQDDSVILMYAQNFWEYDQYIKQNIVIVDIWGATANNAILEAIALNIPFLVSKLPATVEYLGMDYPLFFSNYSEIENIINQHPAELRKILQHANEYLKMMDKSKFTLDEFSHGLINCTFSGFRKFF